MHPSTNHVTDGVRNICLSTNCNVFVNAFSSFLNTSTVAEYQPRRRAEADHRFHAPPRKSVRGAEGGGDSVLSKRAGGWSREKERPDGEGEGEEGAFWEHHPSHGS